MNPGDSVALRFLFRTAWVLTFLFGQFCAHFVLFAICGPPWFFAAAPAYAALFWWQRRRLRKAILIAFFFSLCTGIWLIGTSFWPVFFRSRIPELKSVPVAEIRKAYQLAFAPGAETLFASVTRQKPGGIFVHNLKSGKSAFRPATVEITNFGTVLEDRNLYLLHGNSERSGPFSRPSERSNKSLSYIYDFQKDILTTRAETGFHYLRNSVYDPAHGKIYLIEKLKGAVVSMPVSDFLESGRSDQGREYPLGISTGITGIPAGLEKCLAAPAGDLLYCQGEGTNYLTEIRLADGATRHAFVPLLQWDIALNSQKGEIYVARPLFGGFSVVDLRTMQAVRHVFTGGGFPRSIGYDPATHSILVGEYFGKNLLVVDAESFKTRARIDTCMSVRSFVLDKANLYYSDACGIHRAAIGVSSGPEAPHRP